MKKYAYIIIFFSVLLLDINTYAALNNYLQSLTAKDTVCNVWIIFRDKPPNLKKSYITPRALLRRRNVGAPAVSELDYPVSYEYINRIEREGGVLRHIFKWSNAASFNVKSSKLEKLDSLYIVKEIIPVSSFRKIYPPNLKKTKYTKAEGVETFYGYSFFQLSMIGIPQAHRYMINQKGFVPGNRVLIGVFDSGFWLDHACFGYMRNNNAILADSDFVAHLPEPYIKTHDLVHGSCCMAHIAGYDPGNFVGTAWGADFILARTENDPSELSPQYPGLEDHIEEDNWAAAMVWAETLGVDIVTSSLGYRDGFTDSLGNPDSNSDYTYSDMDGKTTIIAKAAQVASDFGIIIINAMGNEGSASHGTITSPADVEDVISVGAVDSFLNIAYFSSTGPTSDGRIKPDLVAMGRFVWAPSYSGYKQGGGTSYSTPMVAGIVALIKQIYPYESSDNIRRRLYSSCTFTPFQDSVDNTYGRGVPDALLAILDSTELYLSITDSLGYPIFGAEVFRENDYIGLSDSCGTVIVSSLSQRMLPETLFVGHQNFILDTVVIDSLHVRKEIVMSAYKFFVLLTDTLDNPINRGKVYYRKSSEKTYDFSETDSSGYAIIWYADSVEYVIYGSANGYINSDSITISIPCADDTISISLKPRPVSHFIVFPNVLSVKDIKNSAKKIIIDFLAAEDNPDEYSQLCQIGIRTIDGDIIWKYHDYLEEYKPLADKDGNPVVWNCHTKDGIIVAPGIYIITVNYAGRTYIKKMLITG